MGITGLIGASALGAGASMWGASKAADAQKSAAQMGINAQMAMFNKLQGNLAPYMQGGLKSYDQLLAAMPDLTAKFNPTMDQLQQTPGYQWALDQGLKGTQNSYAAKGLGSSGAAMKGAADYAQGLASNTYQQQLQNYMAQNLQKYNMLMGGTQIGQSSAAGVGAAGMQLGQGMAQSYMNMGNAQAAGYNAMGNAAQGFGNNLTGLLFSNSDKSGGGGLGGGGNDTMFGNSPWQFNFDLFG